VVGSLAILVFYAYRAAGSLAYLYNLGKGYASRGWHLARSLERELTMTALNRALALSKPEIHHSDQGVQCACTDYMQLLEGAQFQISMAEIGEASRNAHVERLIRTIKEEAVDLSDHEDFRDAYSQIARFLEDVYMRQRIHSSSRT